MNKQTDKKEHHHKHHKKEKEEGEVSYDHAIEKIKAMVDRPAKAAKKAEKDIESRIAKAAERGEKKA